MTNFVRRVSEQDDECVEWCKYAYREVGDGVVPLVLQQRLLTSALDSEGVETPITDRALDDASIG